MKVLLFTHSQDIDGLGCAILTRQSFKELTIELCKTFEITAKVKSYIDNKRIYNYDKIFVTDLCIKEPVLNFIDNDNELKNKLLILDHHKSEIDEGNDKYDFVNITVQSEKQKESGTSLFYNYLLENNYLSSTTILDTLSEWTRQYDIWDWQKLNNPSARKLHILFETQGADKYISFIENKLNDNKFIFNDIEEKIINDFEEKLENDIKNILSDMRIINLTVDNINYKVGFVHSPYKYRNDINEYIMKDNKNDLDLVGMIMTDTDTVSYRCIKDVDASKVGVYFGGKGHKSAATNSQDNEKFKEILKGITK